MFITTWSHIVGNLALLLAYLSIFAKLQQDLPDEEKRRRSKFFVRSIFFSGILANILFIAISAGSAAGSSGVVFASEGATMGFAVVLAIPEKLTQESIREHFLDERKRRLSVGGLATFLLLFSFVVLFPRDFLAAAPGVNIFAHFIGFYTSFASVLVYRFAGHFRN